MERLPNQYRVLTFSEANTEANKELLNIGPVPYDEQWMAPGKEADDGIFECSVYIRQLIRYYGAPPQGCEFFIMKNEESPWRYYDVNMFYFSQNDATASQNISYALKVENGMENWDEEAKLELKQGKHQSYGCKIIPINKSM